MCVRSLPYMQYNSLTDMFYFMFICGVVWGGEQRTELIVWCKRMSFQKEKKKKRKKIKTENSKTKNKILKNKKQELSTYL